MSAVESKWIRRRWPRNRIAVVTAMVALALVGPAAAQRQPVPVQAIPSLDLDRYAGTWHEVARLPNRFQVRCVGDVTASYELRDGGITVVNACRTEDGSRISVEGQAKLADHNGPASRLKVRFAPRLLSFLPVVWMDYWVLDLTDDYGAALVGTPDRSYLWLLSRSPELDAATYDRLVATAVRQGFPVSRLQRSNER